MKINGSLVFDASTASEIQNLRVQKVSANPTFGSSDVGRLIFNTTSGIMYYGAGAPINNWVAVATGGNAADLQNEVDALETSLGAGVNANGTFNAAAFEGGALTGVTSFTNAITQLAAYATANDSLSELNDVQIGGDAGGSAPTEGQYLKFVGGAWVADTFTLSDVTDITATAAEVNTALDGITATAAELNVLDGITGTTVTDLNSIAGYAAQNVSATEFGYLDGVTSPIQGQLDNLQAEDATLTALAGLNGTGIVVGSAVDTFVYRTLVAPAAGITIADPSGAAGNPTFALADDLAALEGLATTGYIVRTGNGTATTVSIDGTVGNIVVTNGDGVASNTNIDLATVSQAATGSFVKVTLDGFGRVTGNTAVTTSDITALVDATYVNVSGDTMSGNLVMGGNKVTGLGEPTAATDATTKLYVDTVAEGLSAKPAVDAATLTNLAATYDNGTAGVGATLTASANGALVVDGVTLLVGQSVLVKNQTNLEENGRYVVTATGDGSNPYVLTRCGLCDEADEIPGAYVFVKDGSQEGTGWVQIVTDPGTFTVGTDDIIVTQFSGAGTYSAGTGLALSGTVFSVNLGAGIAELPGDEVGIHLFSASSGGLRLTTNGTDDSTATGAMLQLRLPASGGLTQDATGLYVPAAGITNAMLANSVMTFNGDTGTDAVALGETLQVFGTSTQGITTAVGSNNITISALDASDAQKGVASFDATEFTVTAGNVVIGTISNAKLANAQITIAGTTGSSDPVNLGETVSFLNGNTHTIADRVVDTAITGNTVTFSIRQATASLPGVASFNGDQFSVTAGAVSLDASLDDLNNVTGADAAADGHILRSTGSGWTAESTATLAGEINLGDLQDVGTATPTDGHILMGNGTTWNNQKFYHLHTQGTAATSWTVTHNLGQRYCNVTIVDDQHEVVIPQSITFDSTTGLTVTFNTNVAGYVVVMGVPVA